MERICDNCQYGSYNLNCSDGKETLYCKESEYEREVNPDDTCDSHIFIEGYEFNNKKFLERLTDEQLKILILLVLNTYEEEVGYTTYSHVCKSLNYIKLTTSDKRKWEEDEFINIYTFIGKKRGYRPRFEIDDTRIIMHDGIFSKSYHQVLQQYLSQIFGKEYIEFFYKLKLEELKKEKQNLLNITEGPSLTKKLIFNKE